MVATNDPSIARIIKISVTMLDFLPITFKTAFSREKPLKVIESATSSINKVEIRTTEKMIMYPIKRTREPPF